MYNSSKGGKTMSLSVNMCIKNKTIVARLKGEMDEGTVGDLRNKISDLIEKYDINNIIFNLRELSFMDSTGIGLIIGRYNQIRNKQGKIILCEVNNQIEKIINLSGLLKIVNLYESEESAKWFLQIA